MSSNCRGALHTHTYPSMPVTWAHTPINACIWVHTSMPGTWATQQPMPVNMDPCIACLANVGMLLM